MERLFVIDGNSLINRAFYALPPLAASNGKVYNAVFGFVNIVLRLITEHKPDYLIVAFDVGRKTFRNAIYNEYKATRKGMPAELAAQLPVLKSVLSDMGIKMLEQEGVEADDIIGAVTKTFDVAQVIVTGDKDCLQLINDKTTVWLTKHGISEIVEMNKRHLKEEMGLVPAQIIDLKALMGDASDNIPGVMGIGEKTALGLLAEYGSLDNIYNNIDKITGKTREKLETDKQMAYLSQVLATIKTDITIPCSLNECRYKFPLPLAVFKKFEEFEFKTLLKRNDIFEGGFAVKPVKSVSVKKSEINSLEELSKLAADIIRAGRFSFIWDADIFVSIDGKTEYQIKLQQGLIPEGIKLEVVLEVLKPLFENEKLSKTLYAKKDMLKKLGRFGINAVGVEFDVSLAIYLTNSNIKTEKRDSALEHFNLPADAPASSMILAEELLRNKLKEKKLEKLYFDLELPLEDVLLAMEAEGVRVDVDYLNTLGKRFEAELKELVAAIQAEAGQEFNINSPKQLGEVLFTKLGLSTAGNKKLSTDVDVLKSLQNAHPIIPLLLRYRKVAKLLSTYVEGLKAFINPKTQKVHTTFNQTLTLTGRLSSNEPNLQNIPVREAEGRLLRKIFTASAPGRVLIGADYSQIELRLLAHYSSDRNLVRAYKMGEDIHSLTAAEIFDKPYSKLTPEDRHNAKAVNFGIIYGISAYGLANNTGISPQDAKVYIERYFDTYPTIKDFLDSSVKDAKTKGYVSTILGRIRNIDEVFSSNRNVANFGERAAMNMPLQGSASDIIKLAMLNITKKLAGQKIDAKLILQIHDELIFDCSEADGDKAGKLIKQEMENVIKLKVPLVADLKMGSNWLEMEAIK
ncbi:MAG: DNA polymerase I [Firmicutes bacterium]|nr:DNA polymerase I [Bacillota bacterium]